MFDAFAEGETSCGVLVVFRGRTGEKRALPDFQKQSGVVCWGGEQIPPP